MDWQYPHNEADIHTFIACSHEHAVLFFKHSNRCSISTLAKQRLEKITGFISQNTRPVLIDVLTNKPASAMLAQLSGVVHESPQLLIFKNGKCLFHRSHLEIQPEEMISWMGYSET